MLRLLLSLSLFLTNAQTIGSYTSSSSYSVSSSASVSASASVFASIVPSASSTSSTSSVPSASIVPSTSSIPLASSVPPTNTPTNNSTLGYIMVGCTLGALIIIGTIVGIHAIVKKRSENKKLVLRTKTANTLNMVHQTSVRTLLPLPSRKILHYNDNSDNRMAFPPANNV